MRIKFDRKKLMEDEIIYIKNQDNPLERKWKKKSTKINKSNVK
jgi:hypothetical protein